MINVLRFFAGMFLVLFACNGSYSQQFSIINDELPDVGDGASAWADINGDGWSDLVLFGIQADNTKITDVFFNDTDGTFSSMGSGFPGLSNGDIAIADFNNDGRPDIVITGVDDSNNPLSLIYYYGQSGFYLLSHTLTGLGFGNIQVIDFNNDGLKDVLISGVDEEGERHTLLYQNTGDNFEESNDLFEGMSQGDIEVADFNKDGWEDILMNGLDNNNQPRSYYYLNDGKGGFTLTSTSLIGLSNGNIKAADINEDGFPDVWISGTRYGNDYTQLYINNDGSNFTLVQNFDEATLSNAAFGDYNQDGHIDLYYGGLNGQDFNAYLLRNNNGQLLDTSTPLAGIISGEANWVDLDNDGRLDLFVTGYSINSPISNVYHNNSSETNSNPTAPSALQVEVVADTARFSWTAGSDVESAVDGLTYNLYLGSQPGIQDIKSPLSDISTGTLLSPNMGGITGLAYDLNSLEEGLYYWGVQTVDQSYNSSSFAQEQSFYVCYDIQITTKRIDCGERVILSYSDKQAGDSPSWFMNGSSLPISNEDTLTIDAANASLINLTVNRALGCIVETSIEVEANPETVINSGGDKVICLGDTVQLGGSPTASGGLLPYHYEWEGSDAISDKEAANPNVWPSVNTTYTLKTYIEDCLIDSTGLTVAVNPLPEVEAGNDIAIGLNEVGILNASGAIEYQWSPEEGLNSPFDNAYVEVSPQISSYYYVRGTDNNGCSLTDSVLVKVNAEIFIPNYFSPDGDGNNDVFKIYGTGIESVKLEIFNLQGKRLATINSKEDEWNGIYNGEKQPSGIYMWKIQGHYYDGRPLSYQNKQQGTFRLAR
ncbi:FG-GAP-like repeat-containing protein [Fulvivirga maritima]|uniref:FG-GAP-like repeat-containing protein n=1 Tax=Fulvivirga maritima TaxID=2904247 RepID=UPI001F3C895A|nr:FG-GAP-like repeat-containing protein [Fulvivirga maritima]UII27638.1 FG-GAP-like repeat-containing protein [Fulvivirga maritima]